MKSWKRVVLSLALMSCGGTLSAQDAPAVPAAAPEREVPPGFRVAPLGDGPWDFDTEQARLHVSVVARGLDHPWGMAFLPDGSMLVTERPGHLRVIRNGVLDPNPIEGLPPIYAFGIAGLYDVALHPDFAKNHLIYLSYVKPSPEAKLEDVARSRSTLAVMRARWDGGPALSDVEDIFVADAWYGDMPLPERCCGQGPAFGSYGGRILFDSDGHLLVTSGDRNYGEKVQDPSNHFGKILRLNDDGSVPSDNPFVGKPGWKPEIWTTGHRNPLGLTINPLTGALWESEFGPRGGDEVNVIEAGNNYGWILVTQGFHYNGEEAKGIKNVPGMTDPVFAFGPPSLNPGNPAFYDGEAFPGWEGNLLLPTMSKSVLRATFDETGNPTGQELMLQGLEQRFRDLRVGPDGLVYILTDEKDGALLKVEPGE